MDDLPKDPKIAELPMDAMRNPVGLQRRVE
jgi:hypothetical protein